MERTASTPAWTNVAEIEVIYKIKVKAKDRPQIKSSRDFYTLLLERWNDNTLDLIEEFKVLLLDRSNRVLGIRHLATGGITGVVADPKIILAIALKGGACSLAISHSHPSGNLRPSRADEQLTERLAAAAALMDLRLMDHIIVTRDGYFSFADEGLL